MALTLTYTGIDHLSGYILLWYLSDIGALCVTVMCMVLVITVANSGAYPVAAAAVLVSCIHTHLVITEANSVVTVHMVVLGISLMHT